MKGRKIHALVDTEGLPMRVVIHSAGMQDRDGAALVLNKIRNRFPWLQLVWADAGYHAHQVDTAVAKIPVLRLEIVKRSDNMKGFVVLPRRWVVERTFSWFGRNRRLAKDFENLAESLLAFVTLACIQIAIRRLARKLSFESGSECALVIQMSCTHAAAMSVLSRIGGAHGFGRNDAMMASAASKLLRAYTAQVETLRRLRNGGSQFVRVEHVHVSDGGQAVIGLVASK